MDTFRIPAALLVLRLDLIALGGRDAFERQGHEHVGEPALRPPLLDGLALEPVEAQGAVGALHPAEVVLERLLAGRVLGSRPRCFTPADRDAVLKKTGEVPAKLAFEIVGSGVRPPQPLLGKRLAELQHLELLSRFFAGLGEVGRLVEVHHDLRPSIFLPRRIGLADLVLGPGAGVRHGRPEALPEDPDEDTGVLDAQACVDKALRTLGMKPRIGIRVPAAHLQHEPAIARRGPVQLVAHPVHGLALRPQIPG